MSFSISCHQRIFSSHSFQSTHHFEHHDYISFLSFPIQWVILTFSFSLHIISLKNLVSFCGHSFYLLLHVWAFSNVLTIPLLRTAVFFISKVVLHRVHFLEKMVLKETLLTEMLFSQGKALFVILSWLSHHVLIHITKSYCYINQQSTCSSDVSISIIF